MNNKLSEPNCFENINSMDLKPIFLSNSDYEFCNDKKNIDDQLTILYGLDSLNTNDTGTALIDMNFNEYYENLNVEEPILKNEQCNCNFTATWQELNQIFKLTDEEILKGSTFQCKFPENVCYSLPTDLTNDNQNDNLDDFQFDEEYMNTKFDDFKDNGPNKEAIKDEKQKQPIIVNERKVQPAIKKPIKPEIRQHNVTKNDITRSNDVKDVDEFIGSKNSDQINIKNINQKQNLQNKSNLSKKQTTHSTESNSVERLNNKNEKNMMRNMKYVYTFGEDYRGGVNYGHKNCVDFWVPVPHNKGWINDTFLETEMKKTIDKKNLQIEEQQQNRMKAMETQKDTIKRTRQKKASMRAAASNSKAKSKKVVKTPKVKKVEAVPAFKLNKNRNGVYTMTMNYLTNDGRLDKTEEPVVFKLADHTNEIFDGDSNSSLNIEFVTPTAIQALRKNKSIKPKVDDPPITIVEEVLPPVKRLNKKKV